MPNELTNNRRRRRLRELSRIRRLRALSAAVAAAGALALAASPANAQDGDNPLTGDSAKNFVTGSLLLARRPYVAPTPRPPGFYFGLDVAVAEAKVEGSGALARFYGHLFCFPLPLLAVEIVGKGGGVTEAGLMYLTVNPLAGATVYDSTLRLGHSFPVGGGRFLVGVDGTYSQVKLDQNLTLLGAATHESAGLTAPIAQVSVAYTGHAPAAASSGEGSHTLVPFAALGYSDIHSAIAADTTNTYDSFHSQVPYAEIGANVCGHARQLCAAPAFDVDRLRGVRVVLILTARE